MPGRGWIAGRRRASPAIVGGMADPSPVLPRVFRAWALDTCSYGNIMSTMSRAAATTDVLQRDCRDPEAQDIAASLVVGGLIVIFVGISQWSSLKRSCLEHFRSPLVFLQQDWREGARRGVSAADRPYRLCGSRRKAAIATGPGFRRGCGRPADDFDPGASSAERARVCRM